ncbi:MAG: hypothetical protein PHW93_01895 [Candidatus Methanomethylophilaceae archaeon]|nr:hypothetical protein [Candidatus Methanomethylophilaceae archaeon]
MAKVRFRGAKHSPKKLEKDILERSKDLWEDPELLRPVCIGSCRRCHFDKPFKKIHSLDRIKDDADKLVKAASRGDNMVRAYAATISLYVSGKIPYLATARFPGEEVSFAVRGKVGQDKLIGAQYYDDPNKRPLLYMELAKKRRLCLYSLEEGMLCSDKPKMPEEYLQEIMEESPYNLGEDGSCGHEGKGTLIIHIQSRDEQLRVCRDCAEKTNLLHLLVSRIVSPQVMDDFQVRVEHPYKSGDGDITEAQVPAEILERYKRNQINDRELIDAVLKEKKRNLKECGSAVYVMEGRNYGCDLESFMSDVRGSEEEKSALQTVLSDGSIPLVMEGNRASEALQELWSDYATDIILAISSPETVEAMGDVSRQNPGQALQEALFKERSRKILANLPNYSRLGEIGSLADRLARIAKTGDAATLRRDIEFKSLRDFKARSVALAFIKASSTDDSSLWQFSKEEMEFADYLLQFAAMMIEAEGDRYNDALEAMLTASGSAEKLPQ